MWGGVGFNMLVIYTALRAARADLYEAARIDGCSELQIALRIKIPLVTPALIMTALFSTIATLQVFSEPTTLRPLTNSLLERLDAAHEDLPGRVRPQRHLHAPPRRRSSSPAPRWCCRSAFLRLVQARAFAAGEPVTTVAPPPRPSGPPARARADGRPAAPAGHPADAGPARRRAATACCRSPGCSSPRPRTRPSCSARSPSRPGGRCGQNIADLTAYDDGVFWQWMANTALYAGVGALLSALVSGLTGYTLAKFRFPGRTAMFNILLAGVLVPGITLAIPQYLLLAKVGLANTYLSVLLPSILSPYGIYLARVYAAAAVPDTLIEAARTDGASEWRIFWRVALPVMLPGHGHGVPVPVRRDLEQLPAAVHHAQRRRQVPADRRPVHPAQPRQHAARPLHADHHRSATVDRAADRAVPDPAAVLAGRPDLRRGEA